MAYDIDAVREKYIGFQTAKARGRYPVEHDPIRRHCHMVEDNNPLFIDPKYAATTEFGVNLLPAVRLARALLREPGAMAGRVRAAVSDGSDAGQAHRQYEPGS